MNCCIIFLIWHRSC